VHNFFARSSMPQLLEETRERENDQTRQH